MVRENVVVSVFNEKLMGSLALLAIFLLYIDLAMPLGLEWRSMLWAIDWGIIAIFGAEYLVKLYFADKKVHYVKDAWNILNLLIVTIPLLTFVPGIVGGLVYSPILRLARVFRVLPGVFRTLLFAVRAGGEVKGWLPYTVILTIPEEWRDSWKKLREAYSANDEELAWLLLKERLEQIYGKSEPYARLVSAAREIETNLGLKSLHDFSRQVELLAKKLVEEER
jgi:hypothetical protein